MDCAPEYTPVFFMSPMEAQTETGHQIHTPSKIRRLEIIHKLTAKTVPIWKLSKQDHTPKSSNPHIGPLWILQSQNSPVQQIDCEVHTGSGCNALPGFEAGVLLGQE